LLLFYSMLERNINKVCFFELNWFLVRGIMPLKV
jgi:hypothetical protein